MATAAEIINLINTSELSIEDRVAIVRALRNTVPNLVAPERRLKGRVDSAQGIRPEFVESAITALENSELWQQSSTATPKQLRFHRNASEETRPLIEEVQAFYAILSYSARYHHFLAVEMARNAHRVGKQLIGDAAVLVQPHLEIMADTLPPRRRRIKPASTPSTPTPPSAKE
jgi:hypothetical protein